MLGATTLTDMDLDGDRLLVATDVGVVTFDVRGRPFEIHRTTVGATAVAVTGDVGAFARAAGGTVRFDGRASPTTVAAPIPGTGRALGITDDGLIAIAAGRDGVVVSTDPGNPVLTTAVAGGEAFDVVVEAGQAFVAGGAAGVVVYGIDDSGATRRYGMAPPIAGSVEVVAAERGRIASGRRTDAKWYVDFAQSGELVLVSSTLVAGSTLPRPAPQIDLSFSRQLKPSSVAAAVTLFVNGVEHGVAVNGGTEAAPRSTLSITAGSLPAGNAELRIAGLLSWDNRPLSSPIVIRFVTAGAAGAAPAIATVAPRLLSVGGNGQRRHHRQRLRCRLAAVGAHTCRRHNRWASGDGAHRRRQHAARGVTHRHARLRRRRRHQPRQRPLGRAPPGPASTSTTSPSTSPRPASCRRAAAPSCRSSVAASCARRTLRSPSAVSPRWASPSCPIRRCAPWTPAGSFGDAPLIVRNAGGASQATGPTLRYGLEAVGQETIGVGTVASVAIDDAQPGLAFAAGGSTNEGNRYAQSFSGAVMGAKTIPTSVRATPFDVSRAGAPDAIGGAFATIASEVADIVIGILSRRLPSSTPMPDVTLLPDAHDAIVADDRIPRRQWWRRPREHLDERRQRLFRQGERDPFAARATRHPPWPHRHRHRRRDDDRSPAGRHRRLQRDEARQKWRRPGAPRRPAPRARSRHHRCDGQRPRHRRRHRRPRWRAAVLSSSLMGVLYCPPSAAAIAAGNPLPEPPEWSLHVLPGHRPRSSSAFTRLEIFDRVAPGATVVAELTLNEDASDVLWLDDDTIVLAVDSGLRFYRLVGTTATLLSHLRFDSALMQSPAATNGLTRVGDLLVVSARTAGPILVDIRVPTAPEVVSAGNTENAIDAALFGDRLFVATGAALTELRMPFMLATGSSPARGAIVPPTTAPLRVSLNRQPAAVGPGTVRLMGPSGAVDVEASIEIDHLRRRYAVVLTPTSALLPLTSYTIHVDKTLSDTSGGTLLLPWQSTFTTGPTDTRQPRLDDVTPRIVGRVGATVTATGLGLAGLVSVSVGGVTASFTIEDDDSIAITLPTLATGAHDIRVVDTGGPTALLPQAVIVLDALGTAIATPNHGPIAGGTVVTLTFPSAMLAPGSTLRIGGIAVDVNATDIETLSSARFTTPRRDAAGIVPIEVVRPQEAAVVVGTFAYEGPTQLTIDLPGYPERRASDIALRASRLYVGSDKPGFYGADIMDVALAERPLRRGTLTTSAPVRGLDVKDDLLALAVSQQGVLLVDIADEAHPFVAREISTVGIASDVRIVDDEAIVASVVVGSAGGFLEYFDLHTQPPALIRRREFSDDVIAVDVGVDGTGVLTSKVGTTGADGLTLRLIDASNVSRELVIDMAVADLDTRLRSRLLLLPGRAYVTVGNALHVFSTSPTITRLETRIIGEQTGGLTRQGPLVYVASAATAALTAVEVSRFQILDVAPTGKAARSTPVTVELSQPADIQTLTNDSFHVDDQTGAVPAVVDGEGHPISVTYDTRGALATFTGTRPFALGAVTSNVTTAVRSFAPETLATPLTWSFTAVDGEQPAISTVTPHAVALDQPFTLKIAGSGFSATSRVFIGSVEQTATLVAGELVVTSTSLAQAGLHTVRVQNGELRATRHGAIRVDDNLTLVSIAPNNGQLAGTNTVVLTGRGFRPGMSVSFGPTASFSVIVDSSRQARVVAPPGTSGLVDISATVGGITGTLPQAYRYGSGAVASLASPAISDVIVDGAIAWAGVGGSLTQTDGDGEVITITSSATPTIAAYDVSEANAARKLAELSVGGSGIERLITVGRRLFAAAGTVGVEVVDITAADHPARLATIAGSGRTHDVLVKDAVLYVADDTGVRALLDTSFGFVEVGRQTIVGGAWRLGLVRDQLLVAGGNGTLHVLDARRGDLQPRGAVTLGGVAADIESVGSRAFVSLGALPIVQIVDVTDPTAPAPIGTIRPTGDHAGAWDIDVTMDTVLVAAGPAAIQRFRAPIGQPASFVETIAVADHVRSFDRRGQRLFVATLYASSSTGRVAADAFWPSDATVAGAFVTATQERFEILGASPSVDDPVSPLASIELSVGELASPASLSQLSLHRQSSVASMTVSQRVDGPRVLVTGLPTGGLLPAASYVVDTGALTGLSTSSSSPSAVAFVTGSVANEAQPVSSSITPASGPLAGGVTLRITGTGFSSSSTVQIGGQIVPVLAGSDEGELLVTTPAGLEGAAVVQVTTSGGLVARRFGGHRYLRSPLIASVSPSSTTFNGRGVVKITGSGLSAASLVRFNGVPPVGPVTIDSAGALVVTAPDNVTGTVDVQVTNPGDPGVATAAGALTFTLARHATAELTARLVAALDRTLFVVDSGTLRVLDTNVPTAPTTIATAAAPADLVDLVVTADRVVAASATALHTWRHTGCIDGGSCVIGPRASVAYAGGTSLAVGVDRDRTLVAVSDGVDVTTFGDIDGVLQPVSSTVLDGELRGLAVGPAGIAVLVERDGFVDVELRDPRDGILAVINDFDVVGASIGRSLSSFGDQLAVVTNVGVTVLDLSAGLVVRSATATRGDVLDAVLQGPVLAARTADRVELIDVTSSAARRLSWATERGPVWWSATPPLSPDDIAIVNGSLAVATGDSLEVFELPYAVPTVVSPVPGATVASSGAVRITLGTRAIVATVQESTLALAGTATTATRLGQSFGVVGTAPLPEGSIAATATFAAWRPVVNSALSSPWSFTVVVKNASSDRLDELSPDHGSVVGGTRVSLRGPGLQAATAVRFGTQLATALANDINGVDVTTPAGLAAGAVDVSITLPGGVLRVPAAFVYVAPLALTSVTPAAVDNAGGVVTLTGGGFTRGAVVLLNGASVPVTFTSSTSIRVPVPAGATGPVTVRIAQPGTPFVERADLLVRTDLTGPEFVRVLPRASALDRASSLSIELSEPVQNTAIAAVTIAGVVVAPTLSTPTIIDVHNAPTLPSSGLLTLHIPGLTDLAGNVGVARDVSLTVRDYEAPVIAMSVAGEVLDNLHYKQLARGTPWTFDVVTTDANGRTTIFKVDGVVIGQTFSDAGAFQYQWPSSTPDNATFTVEATSTDAGGNVATKQGLVQITADTGPTAPSFVVSSPTTIGVPVTIAVSSSDDLGIARLVVTIDGTVVADAAGAIANVRHRFFNVGSHTVAAVATDTTGQTSTSSTTIVVGADTVGPTVAVASPLASTRLSRGRPVELRLDVQDDNGVDHVDIVVGGQSWHLTSPPWQQQVIVDNAASVTAVITAVDTAGNSSGAQSFSWQTSAPSDRLRLDSPSGSTAVDEFTALTIAGVAGVAVVDVDVFGAHHAVAVDGGRFSTVVQVPAVEDDTVYDLVVTDGQRSITRSVSVRDIDEADADLVVRHFPDGSALLGGTTLAVDLDSAVDLAIAIDVLEDDELLATDVPLVAQLSTSTSPTTVSIVGTAITGAGSALDVDVSLSTSPYLAAAPMRTFGLATDVIDVVAVDVDAAGTVALARLGGGRAQLASATTSTITVGDPVGLVRQGAELVVVLERAGRTILERRDVSSLALLGTTSLIGGATAVVGTSHGIVIGQDDGLVLVDSAAHIRHRVVLSTITALAGDDDRVAAVVDATSIVTLDLADFAIVAVEGALPAVIDDIAFVDGDLCALGGNDADEVACLGDTPRSFTLSRAATALSTNGRQLIVAGIGESWIYDDDAAVFAIALDQVQAIGALLVGVDGRDIVTAPLHRATVVQPTLTTTLPTTVDSGTVTALTGFTAANDAFDAAVIDVRVDGARVARRLGAMPSLPALAVGAHTIEVCARSTSMGVTCLSGPLTVVVGAPAVELVDVPATVITDAIIPVTVAVRGDVQSVELDINDVVVTGSARTLTQHELRAPSSPATIQIGATPISSTGIRGTRVVRQVLVSLSSSSLPTVTLVREGTGPLVEGATIVVHADIAGTAARRVDYTLVQGGVAADVRAALENPWRARLTLPVTSGASSLELRGVVTFDDGRQVTATLALVVVDDLSPPILVLAANPDTTVPAGTVIVATATVSDETALASVVTTASIAGVVKATGGTSLRWLVPAATPNNTVVALKTVATDTSGNATTREVTRRVVAADDSIDTVDSAAVAFVAHEAGVVVTSTARGVLRQHAPTAITRGDLATSVNALALWRGTIVVGTSSSLHIGERSVPVVGGVTDVIASHGRLVARTGTGLIVELDDTGALQQRAANASRLLAVDSDTIVVTTGDAVYLYGTGTSSFSSPGARAAAFIDNNTLLITTDTATRLHSIPANATVQSLPVGGRSVVVAGHRAFVLGDNVIELDVRRVEAIALRAVRPADGVTGFVAFGNTLQLAGTAGLQRLDLDRAASTTATIVSAATLGDVPERIADVGGELVLVGATMRRLELTNVLAPSTSLQAGLPLARDLAGAADHLALLDADRRLRLYRRASSSWVGLAVSGTAAEAGIDHVDAALARVWWARGTDVGTLDLDDNRQGQLGLASTVVDIAAAGSEAVAVLANGQLVHLGVGAVGQPIVLSTSTAVSSPSFVAFNGDDVVVTSGPSVAFWKRGSGALVATGTVTMAATVRRVRFAGHLAVVTAGSAGVHLIDADTRLTTAVLPASRAVDALISGDTVVVLDEVDGLRLFDAPASRPVVALVDPTLTELRLGEPLLVRADGSRDDADFVEVVVDGARQLIGGLTGRDRRVSVRLPARASPGSRVAVAMTAQGAHGTSTAESALFTVMAPSTSLSSTWIAPSSSTHVVGEIVDVVVDTGAALGVVEADVTIAGAVVGVLADTGTSPSGRRLAGAITVPLDAVGDATVVVTVVDGLGRVSTTTRAWTITGDTNAPTNVQGLPATLKAGPTINTFTVTASDDGIVELVVSMNGTVLGRAEGQGAVAVTQALVLPATSVGSSVTLRAVATDLFGRATPIQQIYTVLPDGVAPVVTIAAPAHAIVGTTVVVSATATDADNDVATVTLQRNGTTIATGPGPSVSTSIVMPVDGSDVILTATATDSRGRASLVPATATIDGRSCPDDVLPSDDHITVSSTLTTVDLVAGQGCNLAGLPDHTWAWTAPVDGRYHFGVVGALALVITNGTCTGPQLACTAPAGSTATELELDAGDTVVVAVQGSANQSFTLTIDRLDRCADGIDNDGDGVTDFPNEPGCASSTDDDEANPTPLPTCSDGVDNDGDLVVDYPADPSCMSAASDEHTDGDRCTEALLASLTSTNHLELSRSTPSTTAMCTGVAAGADAWLRLPVPAGVIANVSFSARRANNLPFNLNFAVADGCDDTTATCQHGTLSVVASSDIVVAVTDDLHLGGDADVDLQARLQLNSRCEVAGFAASCDTDLACMPRVGETGKFCVVPACRDGADNDNDGRIDFAGNDPGCTGPNDIDEGDPCEAGFAAPTITVAGTATGGGYANEARVTLSTPVPNGRIEYFLAVGSVRGDAHPYTGPFRVTGTATVISRLVIADRVVCDEDTQLVQIVDTKAPLVVTTSPIDGSTRTSLPEVSITYSELVTKGANYSARIVDVETGNDVVLGAGCDVVGPLRTIRLAGTCGPLGHGEYLVEVSGIVDLAGNVAAPHVWAFTFAADGDGDGLPDDVELTLGLDPGDSDSDNDATNDGDEDSDGDGLTNRQELQIGTNPADADSDDDGILDGNEDRDADGLSDKGEFVALTDVDNNDTDGDGFNDGFEVEEGASPTNAGSKPTLGGTAASVATLIRVDYGDLGTISLGMIPARVQPTLVRIAYDQDAFVGGAVIPAREQPTIVRFDYDGELESGAMFVAMPPVCFNGVNINGAMCAKP